MPQHGAVKVVSVRVDGLPQAQGSMVASPKGKVHHARGGKLTNWRKTIGWAAKAQMRSQPTAQPVVAYLHFELPGDVERPATAPPDLDKLVRAVFDALTGVVWVDDAQVCQCVAVKTYGPKPGVAIDVSEEVGWDRAAVHAAR